MTTAKTCSLLFTLAAMLGACSNTPVAPTPTASSSAAAAPAPAVANRSAAAPAPTATGASLPAYLDPKSDISTTRSVYFDFDQALVKPEFAALIERHGKYLSSNPKLAIKIEGHTDERGSAEYNLALGQKRAEAVRQSLRIFGVKDSQMEAISWGEEKPVAAGHDESEWSKDRRADLQYPTK